MFSFVVERLRHFVNVHSKTTTMKRMFEVRIEKSFSSLFEINVTPSTNRRSHGMSNILWSLFIGDFSVCSLSTYRNESNRFRSLGIVNGGPASDLKRSDKKKNEHPLDHRSGHGQKLARLSYCFFIQMDNHTKKRKNNRSRFVKAVRCRRSDCKAVDNHHPNSRINSNVLNGRAKRWKSLRTSFEIDEQHFVE